MSAVFKKKLRPRFIGPFTVVAKKGLAYTLNPPRKLRIHPVFYVGLLKLYRDPSHVNLEALLRRGSWPCHRLLHPNQEVKLGLHPGVTLLQRVNASLRRVERTLGPIQCLTETIQLEKYLLMVLLRYTDLHRRCSMSKGTASSMWRDS